MTLKVLGISTSPRTDSNSDHALRKALEGADLAGGQVEYLSLRGKKISPCVECNACYKTGLCRIEDDYQVISKKMLAADRLILATPIYFMTVCAQCKLLIDRCQCLWAHKYVLEKPLIDSKGADRRGMVIAIGGSKSKKMFECVRLTMKYFFDVLDMSFMGGLFVNQIDDAGEILKHEDALEQAHWYGRELVLTNKNPHDGLLNIELT